jgi:hypothetical protein
VQALTVAVVVVRPEMVPVQPSQIAQAAVERLLAAAQQLQQLHSAQLRQLLDVHNMVGLALDILRQIMKAAVVVAAVYSVAAAAIAMHLNPTAVAVVALDS